MATIWEIAVHSAYKRSLFVLVADCQSSFFPSWFLEWAFLSYYYIFLIIVNIYLFVYVYNVCLFLIKQYIEQLASATKQTKQLKLVIITLLSFVLFCDTVSVVFDECILTLA